MSKQAGDECTALDAGTTTVDLSADQDTTDLHKAIVALVGTPDIARLWQRNHPACSVFVNETTRHDSLLSGKPPNMSSNPDTTDLHKAVVASVRPPGISCHVIDTHFALVS
jgi:hypothetical protein